MPNGIPCVYAVPEEGHFESALELFSFIVVSSADDSKYRDIKRSVYKIQGRGCNNSPSKDVLQKYLRRKRVKWEIGLSGFLSYNLYDLPTLPSINVSDT